MKYEAERDQIQKNISLKQKLEALKSRIENEETAMSVDGEREQLQQALKLLQDFVDAENEFLEIMMEEA